MKKSLIIRLVSVFFLAAGLLVNGAFCWADGASPQEKYEHAKVKFDARSTTNLLDDAIALLEQAVNETKDSELLYKVLILHTQCLYWKGVRSTNIDEKIKFHAAGREVAQKAIELQPDFADAYYQDASHHVRWGEHQNIAVKGVNIILVQKTLKKIKALETSSFEPGEIYAGFGADRILGAIYLRAPAIIGGNMQSALFHLERAYKNAVDTQTKLSNHSTNILYYAEALDASGNKAKARELLNDLLKVNPETFNSDRIPETKDDILEAKELLKKIG